MKNRFLAAGLAILLVAGSAHVLSADMQPTSDKQSAADTQSASVMFRFPLVDTRHDDMQRLLVNAMGYLKPEHHLVDPASGYPLEGWNQDPQRGLFLRSFTQLTAIGERLEILANIAAGYADNPFISREQALVQLELMLSSLLADQTDPRISAKGLLVNFLGFDQAGRMGPLSEEVKKKKFNDAFGEQQAAVIWAALVARGWIIPQQDGSFARISRQGEYGSRFFNGELVPFADDETREKIMALLDARVVQIIFGDNANLTASVAKAAGALLHPAIVDDFGAQGLRKKMEQFIAQQEEGYRSLYDEKTGTFFFGWNVTHERHTGWEDGGGQWIVGHMNYFVNEFRGPLMFVVQRFNLPIDAIRNSGFKLKPYRMADGRDLYTMASWNGSAFESLGLSLFMQEMDRPGWRENLQNSVAIALDFSSRNQLPGLLSEAYSGNGVEYTGRIGIPEVAVDSSPRITDAPSLYMLGIAYGIAPKSVENFLENNRQLIEGLYTDHGPWEGYNTSQKNAIEFQTTAHTLALILGGIGSADENMQRYLQWKGLPSFSNINGSESLAVDFLSDRAQWIAWSPSGDRLDMSRESSETLENGGTPENYGIRVRAEALRDGAITVRLPNDSGINLSNGALQIRYQTAKTLDAVMALTNGPARFQNEIFARFNGADESQEIRIPMPATPGLENLAELVFRFGDQHAPLAVDLIISSFEFIPADLAE
jgi:hypothetical protein